jgi:hypothetical protein
LGNREKMISLMGDICKAIKMKKAQVLQQQRKQSRDEFTPTRDLPTHICLTEKVASGNTETLENSIPTADKKATARGHCKNVDFGCKKSDMTDA